MASKKDKYPILERLGTAIKELIKSGELGQALELLEKSLSPKRNVTIDLLILNGFKKIRRVYTDGPKVSKKITIALNDRLKLNNIYIESANRTIKILEQQRENIAFTLKRIFNNWLIYIFYKWPVSLLRRIFSA